MDCAVQPWILKPVLPPVPYPGNLFGYNWTMQVSNKKDYNRVEPSDTSINLIWRRRCKVHYNRVSLQMELLSSATFDLPIFLVDNLLAPKRKDLAIILIKIHTNPTCDHHKIPTCSTMVIKDDKSYPIRGCLLKNSSVSSVIIRRTGHICTHRQILVNNGWYLVTIDAPERLIAVYPQSGRLVWWCISIWYANANDSSPILSRARYDTIYNNTIFIMHACKE